MADKPNVMIARCDEHLHATPPLGHITVMSCILLPDLAAMTILATSLVAIARPGDSLLLEGPLGVGKTAFARAFLRAATGDSTLDVPSPSFTLVQIYDSKIGSIFHYDLWRLDDANALAELDWDDARDAIVLVEWPDRLGDLRPADGLTITFRLGLEQAREVTMTGWAERTPPAFPASGEAVPRQLASAPSALDGSSTQAIKDNTVTPFKQ